MKRLNITLLLCSFALLFGACNDFLDIKPKGVTLPEVFDDYKRLISHRTMMTIDHSYTNYLTDDILVGENTLETGFYDKLQSYEQRLYNFSHGELFDSGKSDIFWEPAYKRIYTLNTVINNVNGCPDASAEDKALLMATAKFSRAYEYLTLVNAYANHYDESTAASDLGVPVLLSEDISKPYKRNSVKEVYAQILKDMEDSENALPDEASSAFYPDKESWNALMARICLYMGRYANAAGYAEKVVKGEPKLYDYTLFDVDYDAQYAGERLVNRVTGERYPAIEDENKESLLTKEGNCIGFSRNCYASDDLLEVMKKDLPEGSTDLRDEFFLSAEEYMGWDDKYFSFPGKSIWVAYLSFNQGLNYSETMLTLAECRARLGDDEAAYNLLDQFRDYRIRDNKALPRVDAQDALRIALDERHREFVMRGSLRLADLKRLNREAVFKKDITHFVPGGETWTLPANDPRYILPLPPNVIAANPSLPQLER